MTVPTARSGWLAWLAWLALVVVYVVWGSTYLAIRYTIVSVPPLLSAALRFMAGGLVLAALVWVVAGRRALRMTRPQFGSAVLIGVLLPACGNGLVTVAEQHVGSGLTALLVACVPLYVVVLRRMSGERPRAVTFVGVGVGLAGLTVLLLLDDGGGGPHGATWWGPWLVLLAALAWSVGSVASTKLPLPVNPFALSAVEMLAGGLVLTVAGLFSGERLHIGAVTPASWIAWSYLVLFGSVLGFSSYVFVLGRLPVSTVATYAYVNPVIAVLLGVLVAGERFGVVQLVGGLLVLVAVVLVVRAERRPGRSARTPGQAAAPGVSGGAGSIDVCRE